MYCFWETKLIRSRHSRSYIGTISHVSSYPELSRFTVQAFSNGFLSLPPILLCSGESKETGVDTPNE